MLANRVLALGVGLVAGYGAALLTNVWLFVWNGFEPFGATWQDVLPAVAGSAALGWCTGGAARSSRSAWAIGAAGALLLVAAGAPFESRTPLGPGLVPSYRLFLVLPSIVLAPSSWVMLLMYGSPLCLLGGVFTWLAFHVRQSGAPVVRTVDGVLAAVLLVAGVGSEVKVAPSAWSPSVARQIASLDLPAFPGAQPDGASSRLAGHLYYRLLDPVSSADILDFYDQSFDGWRPLGRSPDDALWLDPGGHVVVWTYIIQASDGSRSVTVAASDVDRARWQHRLRVRF